MKAYGKKFQKKIVPPKNLTGEAIGVSESVWYRKNSYINGGSITIFERNFFAFEKFWVFLKTSGVDHLSGAIFRRHAYVTDTILTDKDTAFTAEVVKKTMEQAGIKIKYASMKHAQTIGMIERSYQNLETLLKIDVRVIQPQ